MGHGRDRMGGRGRERMFEQGDLKFVVLNLLSDRPRHGYEIIKAIEELAGGEYSPSPGVIYPTLTLLEELGQATVTLEQGGKKQYGITAAGTALRATAVGRRRGRCASSARTAALHAELQDRAALSPGSRPGSCGAAQDRRCHRPCRGRHRAQLITACAGMPCMRQHQYRITVEHLSNARGETVSRPLLVFSARNHDDLFAIVEKSRSRALMLDQRNAWPMLDFDRRAYDVAAGHGTAGDG
jgi:DNA-binding PadR family transcriptional regulator